MAIPGCARSENSVCQTSHSDTLFPPSFLCFCQPSTSSSHRLSWTVAYTFFGPKAVFKWTSILLPDNHAKRRKQTSSRWNLSPLTITKQGKKKKKPSPDGLLGSSQEEPYNYFCSSSQGGLTSWIPAPGLS